MLRRIWLSSIINRVNVKKSVIPDFQPYFVLCTFIEFLEMVFNIFFVNVPVKIKGPDTKPVRGCGIDLIFTDVFRPGTSYQYQPDNQNG